MTRNLNDLNRPFEGNKYKIFHGRIIDKVPLITAEGRIPMSVYDSTKKRLEVADSKDEMFRNAHWCDYISTGDGCAINENGDIKIVYDCCDPKLVNPRAKVSGSVHTTATPGALILDNGGYEKLKGPEFKKRELNNSRFFPKECDFSKEQVIQNPMWLALVRGDKNLLKYYTELVFFEAERRFNIKFGMTLHLPATPTRSVMYLWTLHPLFSSPPNPGLSHACGYTELDDGSICLTGVLPDEKRMEKNLESIL